MSRIFFMVASIMGFLSVALGAFAAHGLEAMLTDEMLQVFKTAVQYQMFHVTALLAVGVLYRYENTEKVKQMLKWSGSLFILGVVLFSGSLYLLSVTGVSKIGIITPIGGVAFLVAWGLLFSSVFRSSGIESNE